MKDKSGIATITIVLGVVIASLGAGLVGSSVHYRDKTSNLRAEKENLSNRLENARREVSKKDRNIRQMKAEKLRLKSKKQSLEEELYSLEENIRRIKGELENLRSGNRYELHDPTYSEAKEFVEEDETDQNEWKEDYDCTEFARDVNLHAMKTGIRCASVELDIRMEHESGRLENAGHELVAFETADRGIVFVEPQNDVMMEELNVGDAYWKTVEKYGNINYTEYPKYWIRDINIIW